MPRKKKEGVEEQILDFIKKFSNSNGYAPSVREIGQAVGFKSSSTVHGYLERLAQEGRLNKKAEKTRTVSLTFHEDQMPELSCDYIEVPVIGTVAAGVPITAIENIMDTFPLPSYYSRNGEVFMLKVRGDSMINAGILDGDYVIVVKQNVASNHEIVVAMIDDEATVKRFYNEGNRIRLQPENDMLEPIYSTQVAVLGKVVGVFRKNVQ